MKKIILASQSPRRHEILNMAGIEHEILVSDCEENISYRGPEDMVLRLSALKAGSVAEALEVKKNTLVVGADTIVCFQGKVLGKPKDSEEAVEMLKELSGNTHYVYTGVSIVDAEDGRTRSFCEKTKVSFYPVTEEEIREYAATGEPLDKAGSYGIQGKGAFLVSKIEGDYYTVVGFPIARFIRELKYF